LHIGSLFERTEMLKTYFSICERENINTIFCVGDILDGHEVYKGQIFETYARGFKEQIEQFESKMPKNNIKVYFITGNHDSSFKKISGVCVGEEIQRRNSNWIYCGEEFASIELKTQSKSNYKIDLLHPSGGSSYALCVDDKTEILTELRGWQLFKDLLKTDKVATLNKKTQSLEWQLPIDYTNEYYKGKMLHFKARSYDLLVTPEHRMFVRRYEKQLGRLEKEKIIYKTKSHKRIDLNWQFKYAKDLQQTTRQTWQMTKQVNNWIGDSLKEIEIPYRLPKRYASTKIFHLGKIPINDIAELISWYVTEGYICKKNKTLVICQSKRVNPDNHNQIINLLNRLGFTNVKGSGRDEKDIRVCSVELCEWLIEQCGTGSKNKYLPQWVKNCDKNILKIIFDTMIKGDGWKNGNSWGYRSISKNLLADFAEIALKLGFGITFSPDKKAVSIATDQINPTINNNPDSINYTGNIYCVSVPNNIIFVRRNGKTIFTGNSYKAQKIAESYTGGTKPNSLFIGHFHKADFLPSYRNVNVIQAGTFQAQTSFMRTKGLAAHLGGWIVEVDFNKEKSINRFKAEFIAFYE
jgi:hypothetical protein